MKKRNMRLMHATGLALAISFCGGAARAGRVWWMVDFRTAKCAVSKLSPAQMYEASVAYGQSAGMTFRQITPADVEKDDKGNIHVTMHGDDNGNFFNADFFTAKDACEKYLVDNDITPGQASGADIN